MTDKNLCWWIKDDNSYEPSPRSSEAEYNQGIFRQMMNNPVQKLKRLELTKQDFLDIRAYVWGGEIIKHTESVVYGEDLHQAIKHYRFLYKYNLA